MGWWERVQKLEKGIILKKDTTFMVIDGKAK